jgi:hypothetical protein
LKGVAREFGVHITIWHEDAPATAPPLRTWSYDRDGPATRARQRRRRRRSASARGGQMIDRLISADSHVVPLPTFWREYLPAQLRDRAPRIESTDEGDFSVFEGRRAPVMAINSIAGKSRDGQGFSYRRFSEQLAGGHDPAARIADQEPGRHRRRGPLRRRTPGDRGSRALLASHLAYNEWLADLLRPCAPTGCSASPTSPSSRRR